MECTPILRIPLWVRPRQLSRSILPFTSSSSANAASYILRFSGDSPSGATALLERARMPVELVRSPPSVRFRTGRQSLRDFGKTTLDGWQRCVGPGICDLTGCLLAMMVTSECSPCKVQAPANAYLTKRLGTFLAQVWLRRNNTCAPHPAGSHHSLDRMVPPVNRMGPECDRPRSRIQESWDVIQDRPGARIAVVSWFHDRDTLRHRPDGRSSRARRRTSHPNLTLPWR
jgi:hypothetical protein